MFKHNEFAICGKNAGQYLLRQTNKRCQCHNLCKEIISTLILDESN